MLGSRGELLCKLIPVDPAPVEKQSFIPTPNRPWGRLPVTASFPASSGSPGVMAMLIRGPRHGDLHQGSIGKLFFPLRDCEQMSVDLQTW